MNTRNEMAFPPSDLRERFLRKRYSLLQWQPSPQSQPATAATINGMPIKRISQNSRFNRNVTRCPPTTSQACRHHACRLAWPTNQVDQHRPMKARTAPTINSRKIFQWFLRTSSTPWNPYWFCTEHHLPLLRYRRKFDVVSSSPVHIHKLYGIVQPFLKLS